MIEFLTLFLGLVGGPQLVTLDAAPQVAAVELRLGGEVVGFRELPPWTFQVDFGTELLPRELVAVAYASGDSDARGRELGRVGQVLNLPRPPAEVRLVFVRDPAVDTDSESVGAARGATVRTHWESAASAEPTAAQVFLDGEPLPLEGATPAAQVSTIPLPGVDPRATHLLEVELEFGPEVQASAHVIFGLGSSYQTSAELTALPVVGARRLRAETMKGWFRLAEESAPLKVVAVEKGQADLVVVRGPGVDTALRELDGIPRGGLVFGSKLGENAPVFDPSNQRGFRSRLSVEVSAEEEVRSALALPSDTRLRALLARARTGSGRSLELDRFALSPDITDAMGGLPMLLSLPRREPENGREEVRVWDAVALAGLRAAESNRRRAVLLVVAEPWEGESLYEEPAVRRYLDSIRVPLHVWHLVTEKDAPNPVAGDAERIRKFSHLRAAARRMRKDVDRQRIVWLEGVHLLNTIRVAKTAEGASVTRP